MAARGTRTAGTTTTTRATAGPGRIKTTLRLSAAVRRELAVVAAEQSRDMAEVAEEALTSHLGRFAVVREMRRREGRPAPEGEGPPDSAADVRVETAEPTAARPGRGMGGD